MLFEAGLITLLRTILIFVCIYYAFKLIVRFLFPILLKKFVNRQSSNFHQSNEGKKTGHVDVMSPSKTKNKVDSLGDYVDYEEIDEK
jgi:hypothetical protein